MNLKKIIAGAFATDDPRYRTASPISMIFSGAGSGAKMVMMLLMLYSTYAANVGFGIAVTVTGVIMTVKSVVDGAIDPPLAAIYDRMKVTKHGKMRKFMIIGWSMCVIASLLMYNVLAGRFKGVPGIVVFVIVYFLFVIGYSTMGLGVTTVPTMLTNNPVQRPFVQFMATLYRYAMPIILNTITSFAILPRHNNQLDQACLAEFSILYIAISAILIVLACIGVKPIDNEEVLGELISNGGTKTEKIGLKDMWNFVSKNEPMRCYLVAGVSDKIANNAATQMTVLNLINAVLIGSYTASTMIQNVSTLISLVFGFIGGVVVGKLGVKKTTTITSFLAIMVSSGMFILCVVLGPSGMREISHMGVPMFLYLGFMMSKSAITIILNMAEGMMRADIVDYELERSGNYMPGMVGAIYTFTEQIIASLGATIAAFAIAFVGYTNKTPQMGDKATWPILWVAMLVTCGMPIVGWLCNIIAMKFYPLSKERMEEVQTNIYDRKMAARKAMKKA